MDVSNRIVLDLCGGTGSWSRFYRLAGYDVRLITLPDHDVTSYMPPDNVYGILAAPPCAVFSQANQRPRYLESNVRGMVVVEACLRIIWRCAAGETLRFWCMKNPLGRLQAYLGKPPMIFEHWHFGDDGCKPTCLCGNFRRPQPTQPFKPAENSKVKDKHACDGLSRAAVRTITPSGFAYEFFKMNK